LGVSVIVPGSVSGGALNPVIGLGLALAGGGLRNALATWLAWLGDPHSVWETSGKIRFHCHYQRIQRPIMVSKD